MPPPGINLEKGVTAWIQFACHQNGLPELAQAIVIEWTEPPPPVRRWVRWKSWLRTEVLRSRFSNLETVTPVVGFGAILLFQVLYDDFIGYIPAAGHEVPSCPQVPTPELLGDVLELHHQLSRTLALDVLHDLSGRQVRRTGQQNMDVVPGDGSLQDFNVVGPAYLPHQLSQTYADLASQHRLPVFRNPHKMVFQVVSRMGTVSVVFHNGPFYQPNCKT